MPCMAAYRTVKCTPGQRRLPLSSTSRSAALFCAVTSPTLRGQERQRALALVGEQALGRQQLAATLQPGEQLALADQPDLAHVERERPAVGVEGRLRVAHDLRALDERRGQRVDHPPVAGDLHGDVGQLVAQGEEDGVHPAASADLRDLTLDPDGAEPVDPLADRLGDLAHRRRMLGRGLQGHGSHPRSPHLRLGA